MSLRPRTKEGQRFVAVAFGHEPGNVTMTEDRMAAEVRRIEDAARGTDPCADLRQQLADMTEARDVAVGLAEDRQRRLGNEAHVFELVPRRTRDTSDMIFCPRCGATRWVRAAGEPVGEPCRVPAAAPSGPDR